MALAVDSQESAGAAHKQAEGAANTWSFTNTAGDLILVGIVVTCNTGSGTASITSVTYGGDALTAIGTGVATAAGATLTQWYYRRTAVKTGANNVSITFSTGGGANGDCLAGAISFSGSDSSSPVGTQVTATGTSASAATGNMSNTSGNYLVAVASHGFGNAAADMNATGTLSFTVAGSGLTSGDNIGGGYFAATGAAHDMQVDFSNSDSFGIVGVEVNAAVAGGAGPSSQATMTMLGVQ